MKRQEDSADLQQGDVLEALGEVLLLHGSGGVAACRREEGNKNSHEGKRNKA